jgi:mono/diheme cytochrome c family protein
MTTTFAGKIREFKISAGLLLCIFCLSFSSVFGEDGAKIFKQNCAVCHRLDAQKSTGPGLAGVGSRVPAPAADWMLKWIKNNGAFRKSGDAYANKVYNDNGGATMTVFDGVLSDDDIKSVVQYILNPPAPVLAKAPEGGDANKGGAQAGSAEGASDTTNTYFILAGVIALLLILGMVLRGVKYNLLNVIAKNEHKEAVTDKGWWYELRFWLMNHKRTIAALVIFLFLWLGKLAWYGMMDIGVYTGYHPEQPIKFSHKIHAGDNAINCQYCHSTAEKSRHAGIPSPNVCMNCHKGIDKGPTTGTTEIAKIYEAIGWDPKTQSYDESKAKGIKWVKVHNLQDFVFFSHQQHVKVGKLDCSNCHGDVKSMTTAQQVMPLTMGWCIDCHRKTEVAGMKDNPYYEELHKKLAAKYKGQKITVDKMGGIECAKCHY